jgi:hypothetical protein
VYPAGYFACAGYVDDSPAPTPHQPAHPLRRSVIAVIVKDFTDIVAIDFDMRAAVHAMAHTALPSV